MNRNLVKPVGVMLLAGAAMLVVLSACGGSAGATRLSTATPQATVASTPTPTSVLAATPTPTPAPTANSGSDDLLAKGKLIFEKTAGGVGCAVCHGLDGKGLSAPYNRGAPEWKVREVLTSAVAMSFIKLSDEEIKAVVAYLQWLATQP